MRRAGAALAAVLLLAGAFSLGLALTRGSGVTPRPAAAKATPAKATSVTPTRAAVRPARPTPSLQPKNSPADLIRNEVRDELASSYYLPVEPDVLEGDTVVEILDLLGDPYTEYLAPEAYQSLRNRTARRYSGVGLTVGPAEGGLIVTSALVGPAREAGIRKGDVIVSIDGRPVYDLPFESSLGMIKGEEGTLVRLTVERGAGYTTHFTVVRQEIAVPAIRSRLIRVRKTAIGYVRVVSFPGSATERIDQAVQTLVEHGAKGVILDLRDNPGGLLSQAVQTVSLFLRRGIVCTVEGAHQEPRTYRVAGNAPFSRLPLVVLTNAGTASAAEIAAAALADHGRAILVGEQTYGKGSVQSVKELSNGAALKLTTARYRTPSGLDITGLGVGPDVLALDDPLTKPDEAVVAAEHALLDHLAEALLRQLK